MTNFEFYKTYDEAQKAHQSQFGEGWPYRLNGVSIPEKEAYRHLVEWLYKEHEEKMPDNLVYVCSPYSATKNISTTSNIEDAMAYCRYVIDCGYIPVASHLLYPQFLNDQSKRERNLGRHFGLKMLEKCQEIWIFETKGVRSEGMQTEIEYAEKLGIQMRFFNCCKCQDIINSTELP